MIMIRSWMSLLIILATAWTVHATSLAHTVFLPADKSINPFADRFTQRIMNMDRHQLYAIPPMDDGQFLMELSRGVDTLGGILSRSDDDLDESIFDDKLDDQLALQDQIDNEWEGLMKAGPLVVNYIGNLLVLASKRDFPLTRPPFFNFQHIKDPNSFRATLAQVSGAMYSALLGAHTAMDRIQLNIQQVPGHVKTALTLVLAGSPVLIEIMLPKTLETIGRIANESAAHARTTFNKFSSLQELIAEIIEANTNTHSTQSNIVAQIQSQIDDAKNEQDKLNENMNSIKAQYEDSRRALEKARKEYQDALNAIPGFRGWFSRLFRKVFNVIKNIILAPLRILGCILGMCYTNQAALDAAAAAAETAKQNAIAKANHLLQLLKDAEKRHAQYAQQQIAEQQNLLVILNQIAALDLDKLSEQEIVDILIKSILEMNQIKQQWGRLIQFFSKLSVQADNTQQVIIHEFIAAIKESQTHNLLLEQSDRELFSELIMVTSQEIERGAHLLYIMSKTYFDISSEYMIDQIAGANTLLLLQTDRERKIYLDSLTHNSTITSTRIAKLTAERQNEYTVRNKARRIEYERFLAKLEAEELAESIG